MEVHTETRQIRTGMVEGDLCVWWTRLRGQMVYYPVDTVADAQKQLRSLADADLWDDSITSNAGGLEVFEDCKWWEWHSEDGDSIDDLMDSPWTCYAR